MGHKEVEVSFSSYAEVEQIIMHPKRVLPQPKKTSLVYLLIVHNSYLLSGQITLETYY